LFSKKLLLDVSVLDQDDARTGIQRVVKSITSNLYLNPPVGYRVIAVTTIKDQNCFLTARALTCKILNINCPLKDLVLKEEKIIPLIGDVFLGLDLNHKVINQKSYFNFLKSQNVKAYFIIYDLLPIINPHFFPLNVPEIHCEWLKFISHSDGVICISRSVADEYVSWLNQNKIQTKSDFKVGWFHLGSEIGNSVPTRGFPNYAPSILEKIKKSFSYLMLGTIEPRKGHVEVINVLKELWKIGFNASLVIVGKEGRLADEVLNLIKKQVMKMNILFGFNTHQMNT